MHRLLPSLLLVPQIALAWPDDDGWLAVQRQGAPATEPAGDAPSSPLDLVGDTAAPVLSWWADHEVIAFRLRLAASPLDEDGDFVGHTWGVIWDLNADAVVDYLLAVRGSGGDVGLYPAAGTSPGISAAAPYEDGPLFGNQRDGSVRVVDAGGGVFWLDMQLPIEALEDNMGVDAQSPLRWVAIATSSSFLTKIDEVAPCDDAADPCEDLLAVTSDGVRVDEDADFSTLPMEVLARTNPLDADTEDDGVIDGYDVGPLVCDYDHDGLVDGLELGITDPGPDTIVGCFVADADPSVGSDPRDADSDGGGMVDGMEDADHNGRVDPWETDPNDPDDDGDTDGDGIPDVIEGTGDPDGDDTPSWLDLDADGDGVRDDREGRADPDGDGLPAFLDPDADDDGLPDGLEGTRDVDGDGLGSHVDRDSDGDGLEDGTEGLEDPDEDDAPSAQDTDADGDGVPDAVEGEQDLDCDGERDFLDAVGDDGFCDTDMPIPASDTDAFNDPDVRPVPPGKGRFGGGCDTPGAGGAVSAGALAGLLLLRRARRRAAIGGLAVALSGAAGAAEIDAQRLRPTPDGWRFIVTEDAALADPGSVGAGLLFNHTSQPLVLHAEAGERELLGAVTTASLLAHVTPGRRFRLGIELPMHLALRGDGIWAPFAVGDLQLGAKVRLLERPAGAPIHLAAVGNLTLPSGAGALWVGERLPRGELALALRGDGGRALAGAVEVGFRTGTGEVIAGLTRGPELTFGGGLSVTPIDPLSISVEVDGAWGVTGAGQPGALPVEVLGGVRGRVGKGLVITLGAGAGVTGGVGAPAWRALGGVAWMPGYVPPPPTPKAPRLDVGDVTLGQEVIIRVEGDAGERIQQATVDVEGVDADGLTDDEGIFRTTLPPGRYMVHVVFSGRVGTWRELVVPERGVVDLTVVLIDEHQDVLGSPVQ